VLVHRKDAEGHEADCPNREVSCQHCKQTLPFFRLSDHHAVECENVMVTCPYNCDSDPMERRYLPLHESSCPSFPVFCTFQGCGAKVERRALEMHVKESMATHFQIMCTQVAALHTKVEKLTETLSEVSENLAESRDQVKSLSKLVEEKDKTIADLKKQSASVITTNNKLEASVHSMEKTVGKLKGMSVAHMKYGPYYLALQCGVTSVNFQAADAEWLVWLPLVKPGGQAQLALKFNTCNNGPLVTGAKVSFSFTIYPNNPLLQVLTTSVKSLEIHKGHQIGVKIDGFSPSPIASHRITISDFRVDEFLC